MERYKRVLVFLLGTLVLVWALACGGTSATPVAMGGIPVYPGATSSEPGDNVMADAMVEAMTEAMAEEGATVESKIFSLPAGTTWEDVKSFFNEELADTDWKLVEGFLDESEELKSIGWERGPAASEQALFVAYMPDLFGDSASLAVIIFSE